LLPPRPNDELSRFRPVDTVDFLHFDQLLPRFFVEHRGIRLMADLSAAEYRALYWPRNEQPEGYEFYHAVLAEKIG
jgi:hypothetical protein